MTPAEKQAFDAMREALKEACGNRCNAEYNPCYARAALAAADAVAEQVQVKPLGWYCVSADGMATLCVDEEDAKQVAKESNLQWTIHGTHKAMQLCEYQENAPKE